MRLNNYVHVECDVKGCQNKLDVAEKEVDTHGWAIGVEYIDAKGHTKKYDLCFEHAMRWRYLRQQHDAEIDNLISTGNIKNPVM